MVIRSLKSLREFAPLLLVGVGLILAYDLTVRPRRAEEQDRVSVERASRIDERDRVCLQDRGGHHQFVPSADVPKMLNIGFTVVAASICTPARATAPK